MTTESKLKIKELLREFCEVHGSQAKAVKALKDVSTATVSQLLNDNWDLISDSMWTNIAKQIGFTSDEWAVAETYNFRVVRETLLDAKNMSRVHAITGGASWGKDTGAKHVATNYQNVFLINCGDYFNKRYFMIELLRKMGRNIDGSIPVMVDRAVMAINRMERPLIILNEADKLKDDVLYFFITLYNLCEDKCGIVLMATGHLESRIERGRTTNKKGYHEIFSRLGKKYINLKSPSKRDVQMICNANNLTDIEKVSEIFNQSEGDLRRVKKLVQNYNLTNGGK